MDILQIVDEVLSDNEYSYGRFLLLQPVAVKASIAIFIVTDRCMFSSFGQWTTTCNSIVSVPFDALWKDGRHGILPSIASGQGYQKSHDTVCRLSHRNPL